MRPYVMPITGSVHSKKETNVLRTLRKYYLTTDVNIILLLPIHNLSLLCVKCNYIAKIAGNVYYGGH